MTDDADPITLTVEIDPSEFDKPREMLFERLVESFAVERDANRSSEIGDRRVCPSIVASHGPAVGRD